VTISTNQTRPANAGFAKAVKGYPTKSAEIVMLPTCGALVSGGEFLPYIGSVNQQEVGAAFRNRVRS